MNPIEGILFEPVGCLAEFPAAPFIEIATRVFGRKRKPSRSGSRSYWHLLNLFEASAEALGDPEIVAFECEAVERATIYDDVLPSLAELEKLGVRLVLASSLSEQAVIEFVRKCRGFSGVWSRDAAAGIKQAPLQCALRGTRLRPDHTLYLADTAEALNAGKSAGVHPILMMNDPDEARRLAMQEPAGGIVSLHELPDFVRLVAAKAG
ncbi:MAG TPA: HAD hydrolase-like protein [Bryobacteraceae bacterium]|jgi:beta-phosphoglucomutase-like phosphatase (HAD superfamily)